MTSPIDPIALGDITGETQSIDRYLGLGFRRMGTYLFEYPWALRQMEEVEGLDILDAGCSRGALGPSLADRGAQVTGVDRRDLSVDWRPLWGSWRFLRAPLEDLPLRSHEFDLILSISVIEHLDPKTLDLAMKELYRVARPGAKLVMSTVCASTSVKTGFYGSDLWIRTIPEIDALVSSYGWQVAPEAGEVPSLAESFENWRSNPVTRPYVEGWGFISCGTVAHKP